MITLIKLQALFGDVAPKGMDQVFTDWQMLVGFEATSVLAPIKIAGGVDAILEHVSEQHVVVETLVKRDNSTLGPIYFAFPNDMVIEVIGEVLMIPDSVKQEKARSGLSDNDVETFQEMANLLCGSWNRVFQEGERNLRISQSVDALRVSPTVGDRKALVQQTPDGRVAWIEVQIAIGDASFPSLIVLPLEAAIAVVEASYDVEDPRSQAAG